MMSEENKWLALAIVCMAALLIFMYSVKISVAHDHDNPELDEWYATLKQPDNPDYSCCGKADAYWCDDWYVRAGTTYCKITDDRDDAPLKREHIPIGTEIEIPDKKLKFDRGNPTGHAVVFISGVNGAVFCFVQGSGI